ncbi:MAG: sulfide/dihydroorotate dehydrogenase-like FAD/NAD-binding protein [Candidatus Syntropharchaeia archaeon]
MGRYEIVAAKRLAPTIKQLEISAPLVARKAKPGQFVILRIDEKGERIPLTITDLDAEKGTITIVVLEAGRTTKKLSRMEEGDSILNLVGPLGNPAEIKDYGTVVFVGGGVGIALIYPEIRAFKEAGNKVISIIGARTKDLLIFEEEIKENSDELYIATDDGSKGHHGFVSDVLRRLIEEKRKIDLVVAVGPVMMMKVVAEVTRPHGIRTIVSLNPIMVDGTGMCGSCRVEVGGETKFVCVDGPEFDGHLVDFDLLSLRNARYLEEEKVSLEYEKKEEAPNA